MKEFFIDLNEMPLKKSKLYRMWIIGALVLIVLVIASFFIFDIKSVKTGWPMLLPLFYLSVYIYYAWYTYKLKLYIRGDEFAVEYKFGMLAQSVNTIIWDTVTKVKFGPTYVTFFKKSGKARKIALGWLPYAKVVEIKDSIIQLCENKAIKCEQGEYKNYNKK
ncbi:MAG: hypothetical protein H6537_06665 [Bacteroidales bacterium]|nr:hypothetical protein [Bacteroidales bacterium]HPD95239.1 hypothetical protein [Tenuifilaceae bacterium]